MRPPGRRRFIPLLPLLPRLLRLQLMLLLLPQLLRYPPDSNPPRARTLARPHARTHARPRQRPPARPPAPRLPSPSPFITTGS